MDARTKSRSIVQIFTAAQLDKIPQIARLSEDYRFELKVVATVLPFRTNSYIIDNLIDWDKVPDDPVFKITFPHRDMLGPSDFTTMASALRRNAPASEIRRLAASIHRRLNPHPSGQQVLNAGFLGNSKVEGLQHKYEQTVLYFPSEGQTCHAFCTFCFRWAQFVKDSELRMAMVGNQRLADYLRVHPAVTDVLFTGGDPFIAKSRRLRSLVAPLLEPDLAHIANIRFGTKALSFHPERFTQDEDADDLVTLLHELSEAGKHVAIMAHFNHWREVEQPTVRTAIHRLHQAGATLRSQSPLLRGINDDPSVWARMWRSQVEQGISPYYMFVARDTGASSFFDVPLIDAWRIYAEAVGSVSGLARTARGPVMSATPGKIEFLGPASIGGQDVFVLRFLQARDPSWCNRPFFAAASDHASWLGDLRPAFGEARFFFEDEHEVDDRRPMLEPQGAQP